MTNMLLRTARQQQGWSQQQLADFTGISLSTIARAERGEPIRVDNVQRLCTCLQKTPEQLGLVKTEGQEVDRRQAMKTIGAAGASFAVSLSSSLTTSQQTEREIDRLVARKLTRLHHWVVDSLQDGTQLRWQLYYTSRNSLTDDGLLSQIARLEQLADDGGEHYQRICRILAQNYQLGRIARSYPRLGDREVLMLSQQGRVRSSLGSARLPVSRIGIGTWAIGGGWGPQPDNDSLKALHEALDLGCQLFDTAPLYGNGHAEELLAQVLRERGKQATIITKVSPLAYQWAPAAGTPINNVFPPEHIIQQAEGSLQRLGIECIDCLLLQTWCSSWDREHLWYHTMCHLRDQGKIRTWGIATSDHRHDEANGIIEAGLVDIIEVPYSILDQRATEHLLPLAIKYHTSIIARSPLASEALTGLWDEQRTFPRGDWRRRVFRGEVLKLTVRRVNRVKALIDTDTPLAQVALRFCLSHPAITAVIPGVQNAQQVKCNLAVLEQGPLSQELLDQIATLWQEDFRYNVRTSVGEEGEGERRDGESF